MDSISRKRNRVSLCGRKECDRPHTHRKALRTSEDRFRTLLESAPIGVVIMDSKGLISLVNAKVEEVFGYDREGLIGQDIETLIPERFHSAHMNHKKSYLSEPTTRSMGLGLDLAGLRKDRSEFPVEIGLSFVGSDDGGLVMSFVTDITERKELENLKADFVSTVSHELRTPLTSIKGFSDIILNGEVGEINDRQREFLSIIKKNTMRLTSIINDLLDIEKLEAGQLAFTFKECDLVEILQRVCESIEIDAVKKGLELFQDLPSHLYVIGDEERLLQVFTNLISNAIKYTLEGSVWVRAYIDTR